MNVLILGSGGRESALVWKVAQSPLCTQLYALPGNPGMAEHAICYPQHGVEDFEAIYSLCLQHKIDLVIVGPEVPLVLGIRDYLESKPDLLHLHIIGPGKAGAVLEGSKDWSKEFMQRHGIPTAKYATFARTTVEAGLKYLEKQAPPYVLKADGLAAGKGVIITSDLQEAQSTLRQMIEQLKFGVSGAKVVVEEFLSGIEVSVFALTDGKNYILLPEAKDYKRIGEQDTGPNTGGMGAVSPVPFCNEEFMQKVKERIVVPTIRGLQEEAILYQGFIFFGLINVQGEPMVIEYNCRMGDPETEVVIPRIESDLLEVLLKVKDQKLNEAQLSVSNMAASTVMCVAGGYPEAYDKGDPILIPDHLASELVFHAGTSKDKEGRLVTSGGRVLALTALAPILSEALQKSKSMAHSISYRGKYFRTDIGFDLL